MSYRFGKLWHLAIIWAIRISFQCILQGVRFLLAKQTGLSGTSKNESYYFGDDDGDDGVTVGMTRCQLGCEGVALSDRPVPPLPNLLAW